MPLISAKDATEAIVRFASIDRSKLKRQSYNINGIKASTIDLCKGFRK